MRAIETAIVERLGGEASLKLDERRSVIPLSNFYGIEIKGFAAEIARLALLIAEFQADCLYLSQQEARAMVLPLHKTGQITVGNALRLDWVEVCPSSRGADETEHDLGGPTGRFALDENGLSQGSASETYICGNPPYAGLSSQNADQKADLESIFGSITNYWKSFDYVSGWVYKASDYVRRSEGTIFAFVTTNSIFQGQQVPMLWPVILEDDLNIVFAYESFKWSNLAANNAGVTVVVAGITRPSASSSKVLYVHTSDGLQARSVSHINAYLAPAQDIFVDPASDPLNDLPKMYWGCKPVDGGNLMLNLAEKENVESSYARSACHRRS